MAQSVLEFREVVKRFGTLAAVDQVSFSIEPGEIFTLLGPSGCGKTTTLRLVAGLEEPDDGEILVNGIPVAAPRRAAVCWLRRTSEPSEWFFSPTPFGPISLSSKMLPFRCACDENLQPRF